MIAMQCNDGLLHFEKVYDGADYARIVLFLELVIV